MSDSIRSKIQELENEVKLFGWSARQAAFVVAWPRRRCFRRREVGV